MTKHFQELSRKLAEKSMFRFRLGCVIAKGNNILGVGFNDGVKTNPKSSHPFKSVHAEFDAVLSARGKSLAGSTVYVSRILKDGSLAMSRPCEHCEGMLRKLGIKRVVYSTPDTWQTQDYE
jgi:deoxycytidylate deaminase